MVLDTVHIDFLTQCFNPDRLTRVVLDNFFFIKGYELINAPILSHGKSRHHIRGVDHHTSTDKDQKSLKGLTSHFYRFFIIS